jgi:hypothetical protein
VKSGKLAPLGRTTSRYPLTHQTGGETCIPHGNTGTTPIIMARFPRPLYVFLILAPVCWRTELFQQLLRLHEQRV